MNQRGDDKELKAAFAEFKELLRRETEPVGASQAPEVSLEPQFDGGRDHGSAPGLYAQRSEAAPRVAAARPPAPAAPRARETGSRDGAEAFAATDAESARRRKLIYLSLAIVVAGLAGLGWTIAKGSRVAEEPAIADIAPPEEPPSLAPDANQASLEAPDPGEAPPPEMAEANQQSPALPAADAGAAQPAPAPEAAPVSAPTAEAPPAPVPLPAVPVANSAPAAAPPKPAPVAASPKPAPVAEAPKSAPAAATAALQPATAPAEPEAAAPAPVKPAAKPVKAAKPKPKAPQTAAKPHKPAPAAEAPAPVEEVAMPAPPPPPPAPAPSESGGAFGFVKRTVNSVGSTIGNIGRSVIP